MHQPLIIINHPIPSEISKWCRWVCYCCCYCRCYCCDRFNALQFNWIKSEWDWLIFSMYFWMNLVWNDQSRSHAGRIRDRYKSGCRQSTPATLSYRQQYWLPPPTAAHTSPIQFINCCNDNGYNTSLTHWLSMKRKLLPPHPFSPWFHPLTRHRQRHLRQSAPNCIFNSQPIGWISWLD